MNLLSNAFKYTPDRFKEINLYREMTTTRYLCDKDKKHIERFIRCNKPKPAVESARILQTNMYIYTKEQFRYTIFLKVPYLSQLSSSYASERRITSELNNDKVRMNFRSNAEELRYTILLVDDNKDFCSFMSEYLMNTP